MATIHKKRAQQYVLNAGKTPAGDSDIDEFSTTGEFSDDQDDQEESDDDNQSNFHSDYFDGLEDGPEDGHQSDGLQFSGYDTNGETAVQDDEDVGLTVSEGESDFNSRLTDDYPSLMRYLHDNQTDHSDDDDLDDDEDHDEDDDADADLEEDTDSDGSDDDSSIEQEEEQAILEEIGDNALTPGSRADSDSDNGEELHDVEDGEDGEEGESSDELLDVFFEPMTPKSWAKRRNSGAESPRYKLPTDDDDDDSYLWGYFFSSEDEEATARGDGDFLNQQQSLPAPAVTEQQHSGDSTDEETNLPPPSKRAQGSRAVEVLSADSFNARPPVLGSWDIGTSRGNVGIIDGLTTRTLSPPLLPQDIQTPTKSHGDDDNDYAMWVESDSEVSDVALDEFINTDELGMDVSEGEVPGGEPEDSPFIYKPRINKNVPLFAFRNKSSPYHQPYNHYDYQGGRKLRRRSTLGNREAVISSVRSIRRKAKRMRSAQLKKDREEKEFADQELFQELIEAGAITPLFEI